LKVDAVNRLPAGEGLPWFGGRLDAGDDAVGDDVADVDDLSWFVSELAGDGLGVVGGNDGGEVIGDGSIGRWSWCGAPPMAGRNGRAMFVIHEERRPWQRRNAEVVK
jgi:hypothetical protein